MAKIREIEIEIDSENGTFKMETFGSEGKECSEMLDSLQAALKAEEIEHDDKMEKFRGEKNKVRIPNRG